MPKKTTKKEKKCKHFFKKVSWLRREHQKNVRSGELLIYHDVFLQQCKKCKEVSLSK